MLQKDKYANMSIIEFWLILIVAIVALVVGAGIGWIAYDHYEIKAKAEKKK